MQSWPRIWLGTLAGIALLLGVTPFGSAQKMGTWSLTGSMSTARSLNTATLLPSGRVLVAGGPGPEMFDPPLATAEVYDPSTGIWAPTGKMRTARFSHTATLLTSGKVLVAGGSASDEATGSGSTGIVILQPAAQQTTATAEVYDPSTGTWSRTGSMSFGRSWHTATLLPSGKVLVAGGFIPAVPAWTAQPTATAEVYDPVTGTWSRTGSMSIGREMHTATLLPSGKVLVAGGLTGVPGETAEATATAEVYDPATGSWTPTGRMNIGRLHHTATLLSSGKVLIAGGQWQRPPDHSNPNAVIFGNMAAAEVYDPVTGVWSPTGSMSVSRSLHAATLLPSGKVLVTGGKPKFVGPSTEAAEMYDPSTGTWTPTSSMSAARAQHTATLLRHAGVLVVGGVSDGFRVTNTAEVYSP